MASPCCRVQPRIVVFRVARSLFLTKGVVRPQLLVTGDTSLPCLLAIAPIRRGRRVKITSLRATVQLVLTAKDIACPLCPLLMVLQSREQMGKDKETMLLSFPRCIYWINSSWEASASLIQDKIQIAEQHLNGDDRSRPQYITHGTYTQNRYHLCYRFITRN
jgi:hypothetical protein